MDMVSATIEDARQFLGQHCSGATHMRLLAKWQGKDVDMEEETTAAQEVPCQGISFGDESCGALADYYDHFKVWLSWMSPSALREHKYEYSDEKGVHEIKAGHCRGTCVPAPGRRHVCDVCRALAHQEGLRKSIASCAAKRFAAELLHCKLFDTQECVKELVAKVQADVLGIRHPRMVEKAMTWKTHQLQNWVRSSFDSRRKDCRNPVFKQYMDLYVAPCLDVNVVAMKDKRPGIIQAQMAFQKFLSSPHTDALDKLDVAIASASIGGKLHNNPLLLGLVVSSLKVIGREEKGSGMKGKNSEKDPVWSREAAALAKDSGVTLALAGGSKGLLRQLGVYKAPLSENVYDKLSAACLPVPYLALGDAEKLRENVVVIDQRMSSLNETAGCNLSARTCVLAVA